MCEITRGEGREEREEHEGGVEIRREGEGDNNSSKSEERGRYRRP